MYVGRLQKAMLDKEVVESFKYRVMRTELIQDIKMIVRINCPRDNFY